MGSSAVVIPVALCFALYVPFSLLTSVRRRPPPVKDLQEYYATIERAQRLVESLNRTDLVIGLAHEIAPQHIAVFAASLRQTSSPAHFTLFVDRPSLASLRRVASEYSVDLQPYDLDRLTPSTLRRFHPSSIRWPLIAQYLDEHTEFTGGVLMADVRDTAFQSDPFELLGDAREDVFYSFHGVETKTIGECGWNGGWIKDCFGEAKLQSLAKKPILCSGVSIGTRDTALRYAKQMSAVISNPAFAHCERNGVDQGVHNVLVHEKRVPNAVVVPQRNSGVANLQARVAKVGPENLVRKASDPSKLVAVVHQYDRFPNLARYYYRTYYGVDILDGTAAAKKKISTVPPRLQPPNVACARFDLREGVDLFKARCDLSVSTGNSQLDCCVECGRTPKCTGFTYANGLCYLKSCESPATEVAVGGAVSGMLRSR